MESKAADQDQAESLDDCSTTDRRAGGWIGLDWIAGLLGWCVGKGCGAKVESVAVNGGQVGGKENKKNQGEKKITPSSGHQEKRNRKRIKIHIFFGWKCN